MIELEIAMNYLNAGLSVLPADRKLKCPLGKWKLWQSRLPTNDEVEKWFVNKPDAVCIVCGKVSGNLEVLDFDNHGELFPKWKEAIPADLLAKLVIEQTPSGGYHVAYRCDDEVCGNLKLAQGIRDDKTVTLIETRGEGGLVLCAPTEGYMLQQEDYTNLPRLSWEERNSLLVEARNLDERQPEDISHKNVSCTDSSAAFKLRPGDDFNMRGDIHPYLKKHGWTSLGTHSDGNEHWRRPDKNSGGNSATLKNGKFFVFSSNAKPFEPGVAYNLFSVYSLLEYAGDFTSAANALLAQGYGEANDSSEYALAVIPAPEPRIIRPWDAIGNSDILAVLEDTILGDLCDYYACATKPPLPLEVAILKAIVSAGCALSEKGEKLNNPALGNLTGIVGRGAQLARLRIDTAGGQVCNAFTMTVGNSASGKDIGDLLCNAMDHYNWNLGTSGSAEGIVDALTQTPNGLQSISELKNWLDAKHYLSKAADMFTEMFSRGYFKYNLSQRNGGFRRETDYAFPNVYANIQPDVFEKNVKMSDVTSGFLGRFLMTLMPTFYGRPARFDMAQVLSGIIVCLDMFRRKSGVVTVPEDYLGEVSGMFETKSPKNLAPSWRRLVNEYSPRFAIMLSITHDPATQTPQVILTDRCWQGAEKLVLWFFAHAERLLSNIMDLGEYAKTRENIMRRILKVIKRMMPQGARWSDISNNASYGTTKAERAEALNEMSDRGWIKMEGLKTIQERGHMLTVGERFFVGNLPSHVAAWD